MDRSTRIAGPGDMDALMRLRYAVFCVEQGVPAHLERDALDATALHVVATGAGGAVVGCCRVVMDGARARIGRMAVAAAHRGSGVGAALLAHAHRVALEAGAAEAELHAQLPARGFYARAGYVAEGPVFEDAGIDHVLMRRPLGGSAP